MPAPENRHMSKATQVGRISGAAEAEATIAAAVAAASGHTAVAVVARRLVVAAAVAPGHTAVAGQLAAADADGDRGAVVQAVCLT
jgi:hypothetical protein